VEARLYVVAASHPCHAVARALTIKGIAYKRVELPPPLHKPLQRMRFGQGTVPGLKIDGERVVGSGRIMQRLDELAPEPPLYPRDAEARQRVDEAERWGDAVLQPMARRFSWWTLRRVPRAMVTYAEDSTLPFPDFAVRANAPIVARLESRINHADDAMVEADVRALPEQLDHADALIAEGVTGGEQPNAADLQIGSSLALMNTVADLVPLLEGRPCLSAALREFPNFPGAIPAGVLPADWLPAVTSPSPAQTK
jgi:glutathione S-transferase